MKEIYLIMGTFDNVPNKVFYWVDETNSEFNLGDYAIVEFNNVYKIVSIVGYLRTTEHGLFILTGKKLKNASRVKQIVKASE